MQLSKTHHIIFGQLIAGVLTLLATVASARLSGPKVLAECLSLILVLSVALDFADFGTCSWSARELAASRMKPKRYFEMMISRVLVTFLFVPISIVFCIFGYVPSKELAALSLYPTLWLMTNYIQQFLLVNEKIFFAQILQIIERMSWLLILPLISLGINEYGAFIFPILIGLLLHIILGMIYICHYFAIELSSIRWRLEGYQKSRHFGGIGVLSDIGNLDTPIVTALTSFNQAGSYSLAQRFRNPSQLPFQAISIRIRNYAALGNSLDVAKYLKRERPLIILSILGLIFLSCASFLFADLLFGDSYKHLNEILCLSFLSAIPSGLNLILSTILTGLGYENSVMKILLISVVCNILGCVVIASQFNALFVVAYLLATNLILLFKLATVYKISLKPL